MTKNKDGVIKAVSVTFPQENVTDHAKLLLNQVIAEGKFKTYALAAVNEKIQRDKLRLAALQTNSSSINVKKDGEKNESNTTY